MIIQVSISGKMEIDTKASGKMTRSLAKVRKKRFTLWFINYKIV